jgi:sorbitol-specific phosphotransferase system component IIBC
VIELLATIGAVAVSAFAFLQSRLFVRRRLQFVDAVQSPAAPIIAGGIALAIATPIVFIVPFVGPGSALMFAAAVGFGVARGAGDVRKRLPHGS